MATCSLSSGSYQRLGEGIASEKRQLEPSATPESLAHEESAASSSCGSSASDGSLSRSELSSSSCCSSAADSENEEEDEESEEVSSSGLGASQPCAHPLSPVAEQLAAALDATPATLQGDWLAQHAIPTTNDLEEALRSNGRLAYVPSPAAAAATGPLLPSPAQSLFSPPVMVKVRASLPWPHDVLIAVGPASEHAACALFAEHNIGRLWSTPLWRPCQLRPHLCSQPHPVAPSAALSPGSATPLR